MTGSLTVCTVLLLASLSCSLLIYCHKEDMSPVWPLPIHRSFASSLPPTSCLLRFLTENRLDNMSSSVGAVVYYWTVMKALKLTLHSAKPNKVVWFPLRERLIDKELTWNQSRLCCWFQVKSGHKCFSRKWHSDSFLHRQLQCKTSDGLINIYTVGSHPGCVSLHLPNEMIDNTSGRGRVPRQVTTQRHR